MAPDMDALAEDEPESGLEHQDATEHVAPDNQALLEDEPIGEGNSSEPSSSTGAASVPRAQSSFPVGQQPSAGFEADAVEDSVVPSTPKLAEPRRPEVFSEAVSSPQVP